MSYLGVILLLAGVLALGQAAPAPNRHPYIRFPSLEQLNNRAGQESFTSSDILTAAKLLGAFKNQQAKEQYFMPWTRASAEGSFNAEEAAQAINDLINSFSEQQESSSSQDSMASQQRSMHRGDYADLFRLGSEFLG